MIKISSRIVYAFIAAIHVTACFEINHITISIILAASYTLLAIKGK
jgi:hypothetical protein